MTNQHVKQCSLLVMDMQTSVLAMVPGDPSSLVHNTARAIGHARSLGMAVIYVTVGFRKNAPEISPNNKGFSMAKERFASIDASEFLKIHPDLTPLPGEITVTKRRVSAFTGSDLEVVLRAGNIKNLFLAGIATSGVVLSTVREAADKDFNLTVLSECCADPDSEVHRILMTKIFPKQAEVYTLEQWLSASPNEMN